MHNQTFWPLIYYYSVKENEEEGNKRHDVSTMNIISPGWLSFSTPKCIPVQSFSWTPEDHTHNLLTNLMVQWKHMMLTKTNQFWGSMFIALKNSYPVNQFYQQFSFWKLLIFCEYARFPWNFFVIQSENSHIESWDWLNWGGFHHHKQSDSHCSILLVCSPLFFTALFFRWSSYRK